VCYHHIIKQGRTNIMTHFHHQRNEDVYMASRAMSPRRTSRLAGFMGMVITVSACVLIAVLIGLGLTA
jgi:hypothetical protein